MNIKYTYMDAKFSECGRYRNQLSRTWVNTIDRSFLRTATFIMLNPSTANEITDDPTVRKCVNIADNNYCHNLYIVNLFAFIATNPKDLFKAENPVGPFCNLAISDASHHDGLYICAWGSLVKDERLRERAHEVLRFLCKPTYALAINKDGNPKHPLYCRNDSMLIPFDKNKYY